MKRIAILISGRGSNMDSIVHACAAQRWPAEVVAVISSRPDAAGLERARGLGVPTVAIDHRGFASREAFEAALDDALERCAADVVLLAGFMRVLTPGFVQRRQGRMLNIHPSLLPDFPGLNTHQRALDAGRRSAGATVHFVSPELDHGPIVLQAEVPVQPGDDAAALAARVLQQEHVIYPRAVGWLVNGRLRIEGGTVLQLDGEPQRVRATAAE